MEVDFIQDFIRETLEGTRPSEIKTLKYRDGGIEISPGNIAPVIIPEWLKDQTIEISFTGGKANIKSNYGEFEAEVSLEPVEHNCEITIDGYTHNGIIKDIDPTHTMTVTFKGKLKDGDSVIVAKYSGKAKYIILAKAEKEDA